MKLISFNIGIKIDNSKEIGNFIKSQNADIVAFQEIIRHFDEPVFDMYKSEKHIKEIIGKKILNIERKGKNILVHLSGNATLLVHQKMTGHLLYGKWQLENGGASAPPSGVRWKSAVPGPLRDDPENRFIHLIFFLSNNRQMALCDMRKFAKALLWPTDKLAELKDIKELGPDPFGKNFTFKKFAERLHGSRAIKQV